MPSKATASKATASNVRNSTPMRGAARAGFAVDGVLHILIGALALTTVFGGSAQTDQNGALAAVAAQPFGLVLLWLLAVGLAGLALFQLLTAVIGGEAKERVKNAGKGIAHGALAAIAVRYALGSGGSGGSSGSSGSSGSPADSLLENPLGVVLVVVVGAVVLGIGAYLIVKGARQKFVEDLLMPGAPLHTPTLVVGTLGYITKGIAFATIGVLFAAAAFTHDASKAGGLDAALQQLSELPFGKALLAIVALGFIAFGVYCFVRARFARL